MNARYKETNDIREIIDAIRIRVEVFIKEQGCEPGWEPDEDDKKARHFIALDGKKVIATARVIKRKNGEFKIERMVRPDNNCGGKKKSYSQPNLHRF